MKKAAYALLALPLASCFVINLPSTVPSCQCRRAGLTAKSSFAPLFSIKSDQEQQLQQVLQDIEKEIMIETPDETKQKRYSYPSPDNNDGGEELREENSTANGNGSKLLDMYEKFTSPSEYENSKFLCDENVYFWQDLNRDGSMEASDMIQEIGNVANRFVSKGGDALNYWLRHNARTGYFLANASLGTIGSTLHERLVNNDKKDENGNEAGSNGFIETLAQPKVVARLLMDTALTYEQDYQRIADEKYKLPYDMYTPNRQNSPFFFAQQTVRFVNEAIGTISRRNRGSDEDKRTWISGIKSDMYPDYYQNAFHYQTDGWMSQESANVYETSTESLFLGRQDAMQRTALVPLVRYSKDFLKARKNGSKRPLKVLEIACGTGRFLTFARDNLALDTEFTALDLSPFYLDKARDNDKNWRSIRKKSDKANMSGSSSDTLSTMKPVRAVQAKAEDLPFDNEEFDAVVCMYLYHEIPRDIRSQVASEMARVTKPGGRVILTDSIQLGDRPAQDATMGNFEKMNEPHYRDYIADFLPVHFENVGLECLTKTVCSGTKTLAFGKPEVQTVQDTE